MKISLAALALLSTAKASKFLEVTDSDTPMPINQFAAENDNKQDDDDKKNDDDKKDDDDKSLYFQINHAKDPKALTTDSQYTVPLSYYTKETKKPDTDKADDGDDDDKDLKEYKAKFIPVLDNTGIILQTESCGDACKAQTLKKNTDLGADFDKQTTTTKPKLNIIADGASNYASTELTVKSVATKFTTSLEGQNGDYDTELAKFSFSGISAVTTGALSADADGYVGIAPGSDFYNEQKKANKFSKDIVSIYMNQKDDFSSFIKYGGYDKDAIKDKKEDNLKYYTTDNTWTLPLKSTIEGFPAKASLSTSLPYIYVTALPQTAIDTINKLFGFKDDDKTKFALNGDHLESTAKCEDLTKGKESLNFPIDVKVDDTNTTTYGIPVTNMLFSSSKYLPAPETETCVMGLFANAAAGDNVVLGQAFLKNNYAVFDMSTQDKDKKTIYRIGLSELNQDLKLSDVFGKDSSGLSGGAIFGIIAAVVVVIGVVGFCVYKKKQ